MITVRPRDERGHFDHGWLDTRHTFSFAEYFDPDHVGFRSLRVINEDRVQPGQGFGTHPHRDMEIVTYVLDGALAHRDSMGNGSVIRPGDVQRMTAGTGITHSEFNHSNDAPVHFLQIWIVPDRQGLTPSYEQKTIPAEAMAGRLCAVASHDGGDGSVTINQDATLYTAVLAPGQAVTHAFAPGRHGWLQVARGQVALDGRSLAAGDGAAISGEKAVTVSGESAAEILLFDLA
jgi:redox-sensitive bicupin YhaK (pirin superfamily)